MRISSAVVPAADPAFLSLMLAALFWIPFQGRCCRTRSAPVSLNERLAPWSTSCFRLRPRMMRLRLSPMWRRSRGSSASTGCDGVSMWLQESEAGPLKAGSSEPTGSQGSGSSLVLSRCSCAQTNSRLPVDVQFASVFLLLNSNCWVQSATVNIPM